MAVSDVDVGVDGCEVYNKKGAFKGFWYNSALLPLYRASAVAVVVVLAAAVFVLRLALITAVAVAARARALPRARAFGL